MTGPDRRVLVLAVARFADAVGNSFMIVVLPLLIASGTLGGGGFGLSEALLTGVILSLYGFLNSLGQPITGRLSDRVGSRKPFVLAGLGILTVANLAYALAGDYVSVLAVRALQGVGVAFTIPATIALVNEFSTDATRGGNMGLFNTFRLLGVGLGPIAAGLVVEGGPYGLSVAGTVVTIPGFDAAFYAAALTVSASYLLVALLVEEPDRPDAAAADDLSIDVFASDRGRTLDPVFTLAVAAVFMAIAIGLIATLEPIINDRLGQGTAWFGVQFGAFVLSQVVLQLPVGRASDRWGRKPFLLAGLGVLVVATMAQGFVTTSWGMLATRIGQGVAGALVFAPGLAMAGDLTDEGASGSTLSLLTMSFGLGTAVGPLTAGVLVRFGFHVPFVVGAALALVGLLLVSTQVQETRHADGGDRREPAGSSRAATGD